MGEIQTSETKGVIQTSEIQKGRDRRVTRRKGEIQTSEIQTSEAEKGRDRRVTRRKGEIQMSETEKGRDTDV
jgi:hypothetical protein